MKDKHNGLIKYGKYLIDSKHPNHTNTAGITPIYNNIENFIRSVSNEAVSLDMGNSQKKGGRPVQSYAQSFVFGLPPSVQKPTPEQWKSITNDILKELAKKLGIEVTDFKGKIFANVHEQDNPHLNLVVSRIINGKSLKALDQKGTIGIAKTAFTASTLARCGLDVSSYTPLQTNLGRRQAKWEIQEEKAEKALKLVGLEAKKLNLEVARAKGLAKNSVMLNNQILKWIEAVKIPDEKQEKRQENRIEQTIDKLTELHLLDEQVELINQLFEQAEQKAGKPIRNRVRYKI
ncbi:hypothetical protein [Pseudomonas viridiflava]|uniref:hypothetical protein n=1 Tax=Pseudomonas viridiflava TaxID=33069 RepID=UPI000F038097|nr:hypothetical protein [Pseudomonas viridiflava]